MGCPSGPHSLAGFRFKASRPFSAVLTQSGAENAAPKGGVRGWRAGLIPRLHFKPESLQGGFKWKLGKHGSIDGDALEYSVPVRSLNPERNPAKHKDGSLIHVPASIVKREKETGPPIVWDDVAGIGDAGIALHPEGWTDVFGLGFVEFRLHARFTPRLLWRLRRGRLN